MEITSREFWLIAHPFLEVLLIYFFINVLTGFISKSMQRVRILLNGTWCMAIVSWIMVFCGTWVFSPGLSAGPGPDRCRQFAMAWMAPILATTVAVLIIRYGTQLYREAKVRRVLSALMTIAFLAAAVAGGLGAVIGKAVL